jgi:signal transduction histidine kinase
VRPGPERGSGWLADLALRAAFLFYLIANLVGIVRVASTVGRPYGGFVWLQDDVQGMMVGFETGPNWPARRAGMMFDDQIVRINGREIPVDGHPDVIAQVYAATPIGAPVEYEVARAGVPELLRFRVPVGIFGLRRVAEAYLPFTVAALAVWGMGFFVHLVGRRDEVSTLFALLCLSFSSMVGYHNFNGLVDGYYLSAWARYTMYAPIWPLFNAISIHFFARFPERQAWWDRWALRVYGVAAIVGVTYTMTFLPHGPRGPRQAMLLVTALGSVLACLWSATVLLQAYRRSRSAQVRKQVMITGLGFGLGIILPFLSMSSYILFRPYPDVWWSPLRLVGERPVTGWLVPLPLQVMTVATVFPALTAVAILRYRVFSAKLALVKAVAGSLLLISLAAVYVASVVAMHWLFGITRLDGVLSQVLGSTPQSGWLSHLLATVVVAGLFGPLRDRLRGLTLQALYPYRIGPTEAARQLMESVRTQEQDAQRARWPVSWTVAWALERILHVEAVYLWFYMSVPSELERVDGRVHGAASVPLTREDAVRLVQSPGFVNLGRNAEPTALAALLSPLDVQRCLPLVYGASELVGLVAFGARTDGVPFDRDDRDLVTHLAGYVLLLLKNERTIHELKQAHQRGAMAEERERKRLAEELHDLTLQQLGFLASVQLELCRRSLAEPDRASEAIDEAQAVARRAAADLRQVLSDLSPDVISRRGIVAAVESFIAAERPRAEAAGTTLLIEIEHSSAARASGSQELAVFRCIHEAVRNALSHASARTVRVTLGFAPAGLSASVVDDGQGFDVGRASDALQSGHLGLQAMRDRVAAVSGTLTIESALQSGTALRVHVPYAGEETAALPFHT